MLRNVPSNLKDDIAPTVLPPPCPSEHVGLSEDCFRHHEQVRLQISAMTDEESKMNKETTEHTSPPFGSDQLLDRETETLRYNEISRDGTPFQKATPHNPGLGAPPDSTMPGNVTICSHCEDDVSTISDESNTQGMSSTHAPL